MHKMVDDCKYILYLQFNAKMQTFILKLRVSMLNNQTKHE